MARRETGAHGAHEEGRGGAGGRGGSGRAGGSRRGGRERGRSPRKGDLGHRGTREAQESRPQEIDAKLGLPAHLVAAVRGSFDAETAGRIFAGWEHAAARRVTLRANTLRATAGEVRAALGDAGIGWQGVAWYPDAFVLDAGVRERDLWELPVYREGKVYLQSLSSMLPPLALGPRPGQDILDMCAAPGGKTSQMAALAPAGAGVGAARITACERSVPRAERLEHNLALLGATNVQVMRTDARTLDEWFSFDQVLLDAPCTGSGTVRTHDDHAARHLTEQLASGVERSQRALIDRGLTVLKAGGTLVYSTCSVLPRENEGIVSWALAHHPECELVDVGLPEGAIGDSALPSKLEGTALVCPGELYEGFFVAKLRKLG